MYWDKGLVRTEEEDTRRVPGEEEKVALEVGFIGHIRIWEFDELREDTAAYKAVGPPT